MKRNIAVLGGIGVAAGLMYFLDPVSGRRRRALVRDKVSSWWGTGRSALDTASRDIGNRVRGMSASMNPGEHGSHVVDDPVLEARIRSRMGHLVSHPSAIAVGVEGGRVTLTGDILASEVNGLMRAIADVPGVSSAENRLTQHEAAENVPGMQMRPGIRPATWTPTAWTVMGLTAGGIGSYYGIRYLMDHRKPASRWARLWRSVPSYDFGRLRRWSPESRVLAGAAAATLTYYGAKAATGRRAPASRWRRMISSMPDMRGFTGIVPEIPASARKSISRMAHGIQNWVH